jgi:hypothetical protein
MIRVSAAIRDGYGYGFGYKTVNPDPNPENPNPNPFTGRSRVIGKAVLNAMEASAPPGAGFCASILMCKVNTKSILCSVHNKEGEGDGDVETIADTFENIVRIVYDVGATEEEV